MFYFSFELFGIIVVSDYLKSVNVIVKSIFLIIGSMAEWLKHRAYDQQSVGSEPPVLFCVFLGKTL